MVVMYLVVVVVVLCLLSRPLNFVLVLALAQLRVSRQDVTHPSHEPLSSCVFDLTPFTNCRHVVFTPEATVSHYLLCCSVACSQQCVYIRQKSIYIYYNRVTILCMRDILISLAQLPSPFYSTLTASHLIIPPANQNVRVR